MLHALVFLCCSNGEIEHADNNIANAFSSIVDVPVYASDCSVQNIMFRSCWNFDFKLNTPLRFTKGWFVYEGGNGSYRKVSTHYIRGFIPRFLKLSYRETRLKNSSWPAWVSRCSYIRPTPSSRRRRLWLCRCRLPRTSSRSCRRRWRRCGSG